MNGSPTATRMSSGPEETRNDITVALDWITDADAIVVADDGLQIVSRPASG